jgi:hypothetical protein
MLANHPNVLGGGATTSSSSGGTGLFADGTAAAPSISFLADQDTGIYRIGNDSIGITLAGQQMLGISTVGLKIENTLSVAGGSTPSNEEMITIGNHFDSTTIAKFYAVGAEDTYKYIQGGWNVDTYGNGRSGYMIKGISGICGYTGDSRTEITCGTNDTIYFGGLNQNGFLNLSPTLTAFGQINNTGLTVVGAVLNSNGTAAAPSISFLADQDTGIYRIGDDSIGVATGGIKRAEIGGNGLISIQCLEIRGSDYVEGSVGTKFQIALLNSTGNNPCKLEAYTVGASSGGVLNINTGGGGAVNFGSGLTTFAGAVTISSSGADSYISTIPASGNVATFGCDATGQYTYAGSGLGIRFRTNGGTTALTLSSAQAATFAGAVLNANGTAAAPSIAFASDATKGFYSPSSNRIALAISGAKAFEFSNNFIQGSGGSYLELNATGDIKLFADGTNQNITLTPSGTGVTMLVGNNASPLWLNKGTGAGGIVFSFNGTTYLSSITTSESGAAANCYMDLGVATGANTTTQQVLRLIGNGRALIGTTVDSGALLQVGTDTAISAGGIGFGTDVSLYRAAANVLALGSGDALQLGNAYVGTVAVSTGTVTIRDSTGTVYRLLCVV